MRYLLLLVFISLFIFSCGGDSLNKEDKNEKAVKEITAGNNIRDIIRSPVDADEVMDTVNIPKMVFESKRYEFGTVNEGDIVRHDFKFTNEGKIPLVITRAKSTCGCTIPEWPKEAIPPGEGGVISVRFDTKNKTDKQGKPITIIANTYPKDTYLQLSGFVTPKK